MLPTVTAFFSVYFHDNIRAYLICSSREEDLRFDLMNFWVKEVRKKFYRKIYLFKIFTGL